MASLPVLVRHFSSLSPSWRKVLGEGERNEDIEIYRGMELMVLRRGCRRKGKSRRGREGTHETWLESIPGVGDIDIVVVRKRDHVILLALELKRAARQVVHGLAQIERRRKVFSLYKKGYRDNDDAADDDNDDDDNDDNDDDDNDDDNDNDDGGGGGGDGNGMAGRHTVVGVDASSGKIMKLTLPADDVTWCVPPSPPPLFLSCFFMCSSSIVFPPFLPLPLSFSSLYLSSTAIFIINYSLY